MKILLTGAPGTGKTTLFRKLAGIAPGGSFWVVSERTYDQTGVKNGFQATTSSGLEGVFDRRDDVVPDTPMGNHHVDVAAVDRLFTEPIKQAVASSAPVILIDEIGLLERQSPNFTAAVDQALASPATVFATITEGAEWAGDYTSRSSVITLTLTEANRDEMAGALESCLSSLRMYLSLPPLQAAAVYSLARGYAAAGQVSPLRKLFQNTLVYLVENRYQAGPSGQYTVRGLTRSHEVSVAGGVWRCDCDLANGWGKFAGRPGECSHIQTIKIALGQPAAKTS